MTLFNLVLVALIQGVTEFLPVSSSGHLALLPQLTGLDDQGQVIDVAAHVGTLFAVVIYFWSDVKLALAGTLRLLKGKIDTQGAFLALCLLVARHGRHRMDNAHLRNRTILGRSKRTGHAHRRRMDVETRRHDGPMAVHCADPGNITLRHHNHRRTPAWLQPLRRGTPVDADVDTDNPCVRSALEPRRDGHAGRHVRDHRRRRDVFRRSALRALLDDEVARIRQLHALRRLPHHPRGHPAGCGLHLRS